MKDDNKLNSQKQDPLKLFIIKVKKGHDDPDDGSDSDETDTETDEVIGVTNKDVKCLVIHEAPLNKSCEKDNKDCKRYVLI